MTGAEIDADTAAAALHELRRLGERTMAEAVEEAPIDSPGHAQVHHGREPGRLKASARLVLIVNEEQFVAEFSVAEARVRELALAGRLYRVDVEIRFETEYARHQHDRQPHGFKRGKWEHRQGGKAKYLEDPLRAARPGVRAVIERALGATAGDLGGEFRRHA